MDAANNVSHKNYGLFYIKLGCLLFWAVWFAIACSTNLFDFLAATGWLPTDWLFRSGNYHALALVLNIYHTPAGLLNLLFVLDITAQALSALLFFIAFICFWRGKCAWPAINLAFGISMALWAVFLVMEEIFIAYTFESTHVRLLVFELICLMVLHLLPHQTKAASTFSR